jgi:hypothetical protein
LQKNAKKWLKIKPKIYDFAKIKIKCGENCTYEYASWKNIKLVKSR